MSVPMARRVQSMRPSEIREILKLTQKPGVISFAGGLPSPELFPAKELAAVTATILEKDGASALQYAPTEGYGPLREAVAARMNAKRQTRVAAEEILITSGSQQGLDFAGKVFLDPGDVVLCESPTYIGAINAFRAYEPRFVEVPTDDDGMVPESLEWILETERPKFVYAIPDFQNPSGRCWSLERRKAFMEIVTRWSIPVLEDCPYAELRFEGDDLPSLKSMDEKGLVIFLGSFSKVFCPGLRVGWTAAAPEILRRFVIAKQGADLHTSSLCQRQVEAYLRLYDMDANVHRIRDTYRVRRDAMVGAMDREFPKDLSFTRPKGGFFLWVEMREGTDARAVLEKALEKEVAFIPGAPFFPCGGHENTFRLNYATMDGPRIEEGIARLAQVLREI
jgi:2-aminoadipate transaminase